LSCAADLPKSAVMQRARDPILWLGAALVLATALHGALWSAAWIGRPFAGFLLLGNGVVASAGLTHWPAVRGGDIYQREVAEVDGIPLSAPAQLDGHAQSLPVGTPVTYRFVSGEKSFDRVIPTRLFTGGDWILLFGSFLFAGLGLTGVAVVIRFLRRSDPAARGSALSLWLIGMWALTAMDLYGPYHLFRVHAFLECLLFAGAFHLALVFPSPRRLAVRIPWLVGALYALAGVLGLWNQWGLHDPETYVRSHRLAVDAFGAAVLTLLVTQIWTFLRPPSFEARQRVKVLALGTVTALAPLFLVSLASAVSGGQAPENLMAWSGVFFPLALGYAVLRGDLLQVDAILRRTVTYALLSGVVVAAYVTVIVFLEPLLRGEASDNRWISAISLAVVSAVVILPLRDRVQSAVDRLFFRTSYDFRRLVTESSAQLASVTDLPIVTGHLERVVRESLAPESLALRVATPEAGELDASSDAGFSAETLGGDRRESRLVEREDGGLGVAFVADGRLVATMELGRPLSGRFYSGDDRRLLVTLANQGAIAIQNSLALLRLKALNLTLEQKVEERTSELAETLHELRETQRQMVHQEKMASVGQLVAGVAHEINNPLNFIEGNLYHLRECTEVLQRAIASYEGVAKEASGEVATRLSELRQEMDLDYLLEDLAGIFAGCEEGVRRTTTIVRDLRTFSRTDSERAAQVDLSDALDATLNLLRGRLTGIEVRREYDEVPPVECLEGQLSQVFMNLIANAADALDGEGTVWIRIREIADGVEVEVEDDGCGIPEDRLERIFEPFYTTKDVGRGTGLGLAISYGVVTRHGGRIEVESEVGRGTLFRVQLPLEFRGSAGDSSPPD
jgi:signal transduction histidine kinase